MSISRPSTLGIIACPGSETFAGEITSHLRRVYRRSFDRMAAALAQKYGITEEEAVKGINYHADVASVRSNSSAEAGEYVPPSFLLPARFTRFANGETKTELEVSVRGMDVYIVQDVENHYPVDFGGSGVRARLSVNDHIFVLLSTVAAAFHAGAASVTVVLPTFPYARQHKKKGREALTASIFGRMMEHLGVKRIITLDIHSREIENSFRHLRLENLHGSYQILKKLVQLIDIRTTDLVVVSPDTGAVDRNKYYAGNLRKPLALLYKERDYSRIAKNARENNITDIRLLGSVKDKVVFMADDLLGTGGTLLQAMRFLKAEGARSIVCAASLPLFTENAVECFEDAYREGLFHRIIGTNAVYHDQSLLGREWYVQAGISDLFAEVLFRLHHNRSLSALLDNSKIIQRLISQYS